MPHRMPHQSQWLRVLALAFIAGIFTGSFIVLPRHLPLMLIAAGIIIVILSWLDISARSRILIFGFALIVFSLGVSRIELVRMRQETLAPALRELKSNSDDSRSKFEFMIEGYVSKPPEPYSDYQRLIVHAKRWVLEPKAVPLDENILVITDKYPRYAYGQKVLLKGALTLPENRTGSSFDYVSYLEKDGIYTIMRSPEISESYYLLEGAEKVRVWLWSGIFSSRALFVSSISRSIPEPNGSFINGILMGMRSGIPRGLKDDFAATGMTHILAISGYNITIVASVVSWFFILFFRRQIAFWFSVLGIIFFTILTGAEPSVVRAAIMGIIVLLARNEGRLSNPSNVIILAACFMLAANPMVLRFDAGFQLSFMATLGLIYLSPVVIKYLKRVPNTLQLKETLAMTTSAQLFVLPLIMYNFGRFSLVSLPVNILVLPFVPYAMFLGFITGILGLLSPVLGYLAGIFAYLITQIEIGIIHWFAGLSWAVVDTVIPWYMVFLMYGVIILLVYRVRNKGV